MNCCCNMASEMSHSQQHYTFLNFQSKQSVGKSKLRSLCSQSSWSSCSAGFGNFDPRSVNPSNSQHKKDVTSAKYSPNTLRCKLLEEGINLRKRKAVNEGRRCSVEGQAAATIKKSFQTPRDLVMHNAVKFRSHVLSKKHSCGAQNSFKDAQLKTPAISSPIHQNSFQKISEHNGEISKVQKASDLAKGSTSVFLEVQNLQNTFGNHQSDYGQYKAANKMSACSSTRNIGWDLATLKSKEQENAPKKIKPSENAVITACDSFFVHPATAVKDLEYLKSVQRDNVSRKTPSTNAAVRVPLQNLFRDEMMPKSIKENVPKKVKLSLNPSCDSVYVPSDTINNLVSPKFAEQSYFPKKEKPSSSAVETTCVTSEIMTRDVVTFKSNAQDNVSKGVRPFVSDIEASDDFCLPSGLLKDLTPFKFKHDNVLMKTNSFANALSAPSESFNPPSEICDLVSLKSKDQESAPKKVETFIDDVNASKDICVPSEISTKNLTYLKIKQDNVLKKVKPFTIALNSLSESFNLPSESCGLISLKSKEQESVPKKFLPLISDVNATEDICVPAETFMKDLMCLKTNQGNVLKKVKPFTNAINNPSESFPAESCDLASAKTKEPENVPKKVKPSTNALASQSFCFPVKVSKRNLVSGTLLQTRNQTGSYTESTLSLDNNDKLLLNRGGSEKLSLFSHTKFDFVDEKTSTQSQDTMTPAEFLSTIEDKLSGHKGSNWVHSLPSAVSEQNTFPEVCIGKKKYRNIAPGPFAEKVSKVLRREKFERAVWDHKIKSNKNRDSKQALPLMIKSFTHTHDCIIAKCMRVHVQNEIKLTESESNVDGSESSTMNVNDDRPIPLSGSSVFLVLFKKGMLTKLRLKVKDIFHLYPPYHTLKMKSHPYPVILCAYFIDVPKETCDITQNVIEYPSTKEIVPAKRPTVVRRVTTHPHFSQESLFFNRHEPVCISGRVQRIWKRTNSNNAILLSRENFGVSYSLLLQMQSGVFVEVALPADASDSSSEFWPNFLRECEGKCCVFPDLKVSHRLHSKSHHQFFKYLQYLLQFPAVGNPLEHEGQEFCYQLLHSSHSKIPVFINNEHFPSYCEASISPLNMIVEEGHSQRVSCLCKVLLCCKDGLFVSDEFLIRSPLKKYMQVFFTSPPNVVLSDSLVLIKDVLCQGECLLIDEYTQLKIIESLDNCQELRECDKSRLTDLRLINGQDAFFPLNNLSRMDDMVCVQGVISNVDEAGALTWLQCSLCLQDNLFQDSNLVIYCEDCCQVVVRPILNIKLVAKLNCEYVPSADVNIELLSSTVKRILYIDSDNYQPQCSVSEILGRRIGPLFCCVQNVDLVNGRQIFHLTEMN